MKSLLFIGATLMAGAGIYGFVDFKKKEQSTAFKSLYKEEKPIVQQPAPEVITSPVPTVAVEKKEPVAESKKATNKGKQKSVKYLPKNFSRAIPEAEIELIEEDVVPAPPVKEL